MVIWGKSKIDISDSAEKLMKEFGGSTSSRAFQNYLSRKGTYLLDRAKLLEKEQVLRKHIILNSRQLKMLNFTFLLAGKLQIANSLQKKALKNS